MPFLPSVVSRYAPRPALYSSLRSSPSHLRCLVPSGYDRYRVVASLLFIAFATLTLLSFGTASLPPNARQKSHSVAARHRSVAQRPARGVTAERPTDAFLSPSNTTESSFGRLEEEQDNIIRLPLARAKDQQTSSILRCAPVLRMTLSCSWLSGMCL